MFLKLQERTWWQWLPAVLSAKLASVAIAMVLVAVPAAATTLNFDDQPTVSVGIGGILLTNQYAAQGILFNSIDASQSFKKNIFPPSTPNYASPFFGTTGPGSFYFVDPANSTTNTTTNSVTFTLVGLNTTTAPGNYSGATIDALDLSGNVIAGQTIIVPAVASTTSDVTVSFAGPIHEIRFTQTVGTTGLLPFDNLTFGPLAVPEPSTAALGTLGLFLTVYLRRR
jgi:hypothetical protein